MKAQRRIEDKGISDGITITDEDGKQYYIVGKTRIKITEHFPANGKAIDELLSDYIQKKIKGKAS